MISTSVTVVLATASRVASVQLPVSQYTHNPKISYSVHARGRAFIACFGAVSAWLVIVSLGLHAVLFVHMLFWLGCCSGSRALIWLGCCSGSCPYCFVLDAARVHAHTVYLTLFVLALVIWLCLCADTDTFCLAVFVRWHCLLWYFWSDCVCRSDTVCSDTFGLAVCVRWHCLLWYFWSGCVCRSDTVCSDTFCLAVCVRWHCLLWHFLFGCMSVNDNLLIQNVFVILDHNLHCRRLFSCHDSLCRYLLYCRGLLFSLLVCAAAF